MNPTRRLLLGAAASAPIIVSLAPTVRAAAAAGSTATQVTGVQRFRVGDRVVTALLDGHLALQADMFSNLSAEEATTLLEQAYRDSGPVPTGVNAYVVEGGGETVLIDAGGAGAFDGLGHLDSALEQAGYAKEDIARVLVTHLHPDHIGGLASDGQPDFPNATVHVHQADIDFWTSQQNRDGAPEDAKGFFDLAKSTLEAYGDKLQPFDQDGEIAGGFTAMHLPGHTPGHTGYRIGEGADSLTVWGDVVHVGAFQFPKPDAAVGFDVNPETAIETRKKLFDRAASERLRIAGMHLAFPGIGHVEQADQGYRFVAEPWTFAIE